MRSLFKNNGKYSVIILVIVFLLIFAITKNFFTFSYNLRRNIIPVFLSGIEKISFVNDFFQRSRNFLHNLRYLGYLSQELEKLKDINYQLLNKVLELEELREENIFLRKIFNLENRKEKWQVILAQIILFDIGEGSGVFWINKGENDGLHSGMNVVTNKNILIGRIIDVFPQYSKVESIFSPGSKIRVQNLRTRILSIIERDRLGILKLILVDPETDMQEGDLLITSGEDAKFLKGLLVGKIGKIKNNDKKNSSFISFRELPVESLVEISKLFTVAVITNFP